VRVDKLGEKKIVHDPKQKVPPSQTDFTPLVTTYQAPLADSNEGIECGIDIKYEPSNLGESRAQLTVISPEGGEYNCLLIGQASAPIPKGPFKIGAKPVNIDFKNPFNEAGEFTIRIDNPSFTTGAKSPAKIDKKGINIGVTYKPVQGYPSTGRLIVSTGDMPPWIYYLQGE